MSTAVAVDRAGVAPKAPPSVDALQVFVEAVDGADAARGHGVGPGVRVDSTGGAREHGDL